MRYLPLLRYVLFFYAVMCIVGAGLEWAYGALWGMLGTAPWLYPGSALHYTSLEVLPMWGFGSLVCVAIYEAVMRRDKHYLVLTMPPLVLAALWVLLWSRL